MKNNYEKYISEVWEMKNNAYNDFKESKYSNYCEYAKNELKDTKLNYRKEIETVVHN